MIKLHFHADCDGIVSAFFVSGELDRLEIPYSLYPSLGSTVELSGKGNISLDISNTIPVNPKSKWNLSIDHHISDRSPILYSNPRNSGFEWPVCFTTYALFGDTSESWKAAIAVVADWCAEKVPPSFWDTVKSRWPDLVPEVNQKTLVEHQLGEMAIMIDSTVSLDRAKGAIYALSALKAAKSPKEFLEGKGKAGKMKKIKDQMLKEVDFVLGNERVSDKFILLRFESPHRLKSLVAAKSKDRHPNKMIVIAQDEKDKVRLSFRNGDNLDKLIKELTKGIGDGGGHPKASGGWIAINKWDEFNERLEKWADGL